MYAQAARVFLVDLLTSSADHLEACLPCLTAALAAWPEVLHKKSSPSMGQEEALLQARVSSRFSRRLLFVEKVLTSSMLRAGLLVALCQ